MDAGNMMKPGLARGTLRVIGATTINEYRRYIDSGGEAVSEAARKHLAEAGYDETFGARPLKRLIQNEILDPLSLMIIEGKAEGETKVDFKDGG